jgi:hypothetical protein
MFNHLKTEYGETPIVYGQGFTVPDESMTLWINANTTSWTLLLTRGQETCIVGAGSRFTVIDGGKKI